MKGILDLDVIIHKGRNNSPVVILIHGLGMNKEIWLNPLETKVFAQNIPLRVIAATPPRPRSRINKGFISIGNTPEMINSLWSVLKDEGFNIVCFSQRRPVGPIDVAVEDLEYVIKRIKRLFPKCPLVLIGHSRGGLIARRFMQKRRYVIKALITIGTPHAGSSLSQIGNYLEPLYPLIKRTLPEDTHTAISRIIKRIHDLLEGNALKELLPDSDFFDRLNDSPRKGVRYLSFGGTRPRILTVYAWRKRGVKIYPRPILSIPDSILKILPSKIIPDEMIDGKGDLLVTAKSSVLPWAEEHYNLPVNHVSILWNKKTLEKTIQLLRKI
jgi:pimeloyl-ACP methyl ester carboxylesterase